MSKTKKKLFVGSVSQFDAISFFDFTKKDLVLDVLCLDRQIMYQGAKTMGL